MSTTMRIACPEFIGRQEQRTAVGTLLDSAASGAGRTVLLESESGMGKSRMTEEIVARARTAGFEVLIGRCFESERFVPFAVLDDVLMEADQHGNEGAPLAAASGLDPVEPAGVDQGPPVGLMDARPPGNRYQQILRTLLHHVARLASDQPVLIVIEDMHWIDDASLPVVDALSRRLAHMPVVLLLTCRKEEVPGPVEHVIAGMHRSDVLTVIGLEALTIAETTAFIRSVFGLDQPPGAAFVRALHSLTGGNPFFMEEVLGALVASGDIYRTGRIWERKALDALAIPRSVQAAVATRTSGLSADARRVMEIAAILGQRFEVGLLDELAGIDEAALLRALRELVDASILVEESADEFRFRHALIQHAIEDRMLLREQRVLHKAAMRALMDRRPDSARPSDIAHHAYMAESWEEARSHASRAGTQALAMGAPQAAVAQFDMALDAAARMGADPPWEAVHGRAKALDTIGDFDAARVDYELAQRIGKANGSVRDEWEAALDLGFLWCSRNYAEARPLLERALEIARASGEDALVAHSLNRIGNWLANANEPEAGLEHHLQALEVFRRLGDRHGEAQTLDMASMAYTMGGDLVSAARLNREVIRIFRELGDQIGEASNAGPNLPNILFDMVTFVGVGTVQGMREHATRAVSLARQSSWMSGEAYATSLLGASTFVGGDPGEGIAVLRNAYDLAASIDHHEWMVLSSWGLANLLMETGSLEEAVSLLEDARDLALRIQSQSWIVSTTASLAMARVRQSRLADASELLDPTGDGLRSATEGDRLHWLAQAELRLAEGRFEDALEIVEGLYATAKNLSHEGDLPILALIKVTALLQARQPEQALALVDAALATTLAQGARTTEARLRAIRVHALDVLGRHDEAVQERDVVSGHIAEMARTLQPGKERDRYLAWALDQLPPSYRKAPQTGRGGGLTRREEEVAGLVSTGMTNREIAERLFIAERTVESHVSAIMRKLGFTARTQIAAWTVERDHPGT
jgi:DNA-binding NarL/FixJ family response regulator